MSRPNARSRDNETDPLVTARARGVRRLSAGIDRVPLAVLPICFKVLSLKTGGLYEAAVEGPDWRAGHVGGADTDGGHLHPHR